MATMATTTTITANNTSEKIRRCHICNLDANGFSDTQPYYEIVIPNNINWVVCRTCYNMLDDENDVPFALCSNNVDGTCNNHYLFPENIVFWTSVMEPETAIPYTYPITVVMRDECGYPCFASRIWKHRNYIIDIPCSTVCMDCIHKNIHKCKCELCSKLRGNRLHIG